MIHTLNASQLETLSGIVAESARQATKSLSLWLGKDVRVLVDPLEQTSLEAATEALGAPDETICACCMRVSGGMQGHLLLSFDDPSGLAMCDALLEEREPAENWSELEISAANETTNIVGCAFLNALAKLFAEEHSPVGSEAALRIGSLMPTPPLFARDYAAAIMQFLLLDQASEVDSVLLAKTHFFVDATPVSWQLLLIPDAPSLLTLSEKLR